MKKLLVILMVAGIVLSAAAQSSKEEPGSKREKRTGPSRSRHAVKKRGHARLNTPLPSGGASSRKADAELAQIERQAARPRVERARTTPKTGGKLPVLAEKPTTKNSEMNFQYHPPKSSTGGKSGARRGRQMSSGRGTGIRMH
jgi:hypothetical protein